MVICYFHLPIPQAVLMVQAKVSYNLPVNAADLPRGLQKVKLPLTG